ncbi:MAG TPA: CPBP family intramembrane glutamic endopeptidase [Acidobacteriaceae bacterium]|nr:CPBP family intramembrane glutamic endopeptidase [Acidobacteriaceae bacterium]
MSDTNPEAEIEAIGPDLSSVQRAQPGVVWVFLGPQGIRAGWGILLFGGIWYALFYALQWLLMPHVHFDPQSGVPPGTGMVVELVQFIPAVIATWVLSRIEGRPVLAYGFEGRARAVRLVSGLAWGFVAISGLVLTLWKLGYLALQPGMLPAGTAAKDAALWGVVFLVVGFFEESFFRGYAQFTLMRGVGFWWGALLFAAVFGFMHRTNPGESPVGLASVVGVGLVFCLSVWYTGSLWWAVGFHAAWDWGQSYFYGTADSGMVAGGHLLREHPVGAVLWSGGTTGPEGSILVVPVLLVMALAMALWWGRRVQSPFAEAAWKPLRKRIQ